ncbi:MAG: right-handed parallel beta-helix repeat-containing protein [Planctomycetaceae bacterium]
MPICPTRRSVIARLIALLLLVMVYLQVFGFRLTDDIAAQPQPGQPVATDPAPLEDSTDALQSQLNDPNLKSVDRWTGLVERRITRTLTIDLDKIGPAALRGLGLSRIVMDGPGPALRIIGTHEGTADPQSVKPNVWERQRMPIIDGLEIVGTHPEACGIELVGTMQATITRANIRNCLHAIRLAARNRNVLIANCHLYENRGCGVLLDDVDLHQINITGCHISYNNQGGVVSRKGNVRNLHITGCDLESNMSAEAEPTANVLIDCRESKSGTAEVAITGCTIQHNSTGPDSANIRILGRSLPMGDDQPVREGNMTITGNILSDVQCNVHLQECRGVTLMGNTFWMGYQHNLLVEDCSHVIVGPNNLDRNPRYAYGTALTTKNAVVFRNCSDCTISGLHVTHAWNADAGVVLEKCSWMNIDQLTVLDCDHIGLLVKDCDHCRISGLMIRDQRETSTDPVSVQIEGSEAIKLIDDGLTDGRIEGEPSE